jgi:deoxyribodipyrimidine photolyase-related protein
MSDYCSSCIYDPKEKYGETACPFNYLYRNFVEEKKADFIKGRQPFILKHLEKIDRHAIIAHVAAFIKKITYRYENTRKRGL